MPFLLALRSMDNAPTNADVDDLRGAIVLVGAECLFHAEALARYAEAAKGGSATAEGSVDAGSELFSRLRHVLEDGTNAAKSAGMS